MHILILNAISWKSGISDLSIVGIFRKFKYLLKDKVKQEAAIIFKPFSYLDADFKNHHDPTKWLLGFLFINTFLNWLCIDWHMDHDGYEGCKTIFY